MVRRIRSIISLICIIALLVIFAVILQQILINFVFLKEFKLSLKSIRGFLDHTKAEDLKTLKEKYGKKDINFLSYRTDQAKFEPFNEEKLIHLDLKGAPPFLSYYKTFFPYIKSLGATGLLIEYEDIFPYENYLEEIKALNAYKPSEIKEILNMAKENDLSVIPLIQTFGHLEFVLKKKNFRELREIDMYPQVLCPSHNKINHLLHEMIKQVLNAHPQTKYIHIGCDEVYYLGRCDRCLNLMKKNDVSEEYLFLNHVMNIATHIKNNYPGVRPILWGDKFSKINNEMIKKFPIHKVADVMIWTYITNVSKHITNDLLDFFARHFKSIWIASAFKGATGVNQIVTDARHHLRNHMSWIEIVSKWKDRIHFKGIALTGWQRYDHFAVLCELLPVSIPSLTLSLQYLKGIDKDFHEKKILDILQCDSSIPFSPSDITQLPFAKCNFPGSRIHKIINKFYSFSKFITRPDSPLANGWFSLYNIVNKFSSPAQVQKFRNLWPFEDYLEELRYLEERISEELGEVYDEHTVGEWILTYVSPLKIRLQAYFHATQVLMHQTVWPRRPLMNGTEIIEMAMSKICGSNDQLACGLLLI